MTFDGEVEINEISFAGSSVKVNFEAGELKSDISKKPAISGYTEIVKVNLKDSGLNVDELFDKYEAVSVKYTVTGDQNNMQTKLVGEVNCETPIDDKDWNKKVAAIQYGQGSEISATLPISGLAKNEVAPSIVIATNGLTNFEGDITITEIKMIGNK